MALYEGSGTDNSYTRELSELKRKFRNEKFKLQKAIDRSDANDNQREWEAMWAVVRRFEEAKRDPCLSD